MPPRIQQELGSRSGLSFVASKGDSKLAIVAPERAAELSRPVQNWTDRLDWIPLTQLVRTPQRTSRVGALAAIKCVGIPARTLVGTVELRI